MELKQAKCSYFSSGKKKQQKNLARSENEATKHTNFRATISDFEIRFVKKKINKKLNACDESFCQK
jgi:hypothetical protein